MQNCATILEPSQNHILNLNPIKTGQHREFQISIYILSFFAASSSFSRIELQAHRDQGRRQAPRLIQFAQAMGALPAPAPQEPAAEQNIERRLALGRPLVFPGIPQNPAPANIPPLIPVGLE